MEASRSIEKIFSTKEFSYHGLDRHVLIGKKDNVEILDPFIMWIHDSGSKPANLPDHPHRGTEGISLAIDTGLLHEDSLGDKEKLEEGDAIYINAGKGMIHCEAPGFEERKSNFLTLWCFLNQENRMKDPEENQYKFDQFPIVTEHGLGVAVKVLVGKYQDQKSPLHTINDMKYLDVRMEKLRKFSCSIPSNWNCAVYVFNGRARFGGDHKLAEKFDLLILKPNNSDYFEVETEDEECRFFVLAGRPIGEPIYHHEFWYGSSENEIKQAAEDFKLSINGFEKVASWHSEIGKSLHA